MCTKAAALVVGLLLVQPLTVRAQAAADPGLEFSPDYVARLAADMARKPFLSPSEGVPPPWDTLGYDQYRDIRFRRERAIWHGEGRNFELQLLPAGWLFKYPIAVHIVDRGRARPIGADNAMFEFGRLAGQPSAGVMPFSGVRLNGPLNRPAVFDEIVVFQGASYFRALSRGQAYGISARGLAIDTGEQSGEEFPFFRTFWVETPVKNARALVMHALLDSPSTTGAYTFRIAGGAPTAIDVEVQLFPRRDGMRVGVAPLTSMFLFSPIDKSRISDFRRAVHDSDGLAIASASGERVWRPLTNPRRLQVSEFLVHDLAGFGLAQRQRRPADYEDLEAAYERRPSGWIEPRGAWGSGSVHLVEIPSEEEIHDNIVAYWRPREPYQKAQTYRFAYRIVWPDHVPSAPDKAIVRDTFSGLANGPDRKSGAVRYAVDFAGPALAGLKDLPEAALSASAGRVDAPVVQRNPSTRGVRVDFLLRPENADLVELRLELKSADKTISEVWLSRWTK